jgi:ankyrin repeat protein
MPNYVREPITRDKETALHIAAAAQHTTFIDGLLSSELGMTPEDVAMQTSYGFTTLHSAAQSGNVRIAEQLVIKNNCLLLILDINDDTPLNVAAYLGHANMVSYLLSMTPLEKLNVEKCNDLFHDTIYNDMYGKPYI